MSAPVDGSGQGVPVDAGLVIEHLERIHVATVRELAVTAARLATVEGEKAELQRQLRVREATQISPPGSPDVVSD